MALAVPNEVALEEGEGSFIERTPAQERARVEKARSMRSQSDYITSNNTSKKVVNSIEDERQEGETQQDMENRKLFMAQQRVQALRGVRVAQQTPSASEKSVVDYLGYFPAFAVAICKDLLDLVGIGSLPVIGWVVTFMATVLIGCSLFLTDSTMSVQTSRKMITRLGVLGIVMMVEGVAVGINLFPLETAAVALILLLDLGAVKKAAKIIGYTPAGRASKVVVK